MYDKKIQTNGRICELRSDITELSEIGGKGYTTSIGMVKNGRID